MAAMVDPENEDLEEIVGYAAARIARSITADAAPNADATGGCVASLTEAVMGMTAALVQIADAISEIAEVQRNRYDDEVNEASPKEPPRSTPPRVIN